MRKLDSSQMKASPDLMALFKGVEKANNKRTSSTLFEELEDKEEQIEVKPLTNEQLQRLYKLMSRNRIPSFYRMVIVNMFNIYGIKFHDTQRSMRDKLHVSIWTINNMLKYLRQIGITVKTIEGAAGRTLVDATDILNSDFQICLFIKP